MDFLGTTGDGRYCVSAEDEIIQTLLMYCWPFEFRYGDRTDAIRQAERALATWVVQGLPCRHEGSKRFFDFCQVINFVKWTARMNGDPTYEQCAVPSAQHRARELTPVDGGTAGTSGVHDPARFVVSLRREYNLEGLAPGSMARVRLPFPVEDAAQGQVVIERLQPTAADWRTTSPGRLDVRVAVSPDYARVAVEGHFALTSAWTSFEVDPSRLEPWDTADPHYKLYTRRAEGLVRVSSVISSLAETLAGSTRNAWEAVNAFWGFFFERMKMGYVHHGLLDPYDPLGSLVERGWFDCFTGSALLVGLCRARGIPARIVSGITLSTTIPAYHYWAEVCLLPYGWLPLDLGSVELSGGRIAVDPWSTWYLGRLDYRMKTQCLPHVMLGNPGVRFPREWYMVPVLTAEGTETSYYSLATRQLLYREAIRVQREPARGDAR